MLDWIRQRRRMVGGLYFGPPAWSPESIEGLVSASVSATVSTPPEAKDAPSNPPTENAITREGLVELIQRAGVAQTSAILPALGEQVQNLGQRKVRALVLNMLPTQPEYALQLAMTRVALPDMLAGLAVLQKVIEARRVAVVIDRHDWSMRRIWKRAPRPIKFRIIKLLNKYPQAHHTVLLRTLYGRKVHPNELPTAANRMVVDPIACWGLGRYLRTQQPMTERPVQLFVRVANRGGVPRVVMGRIGESVATLLERCGVRGPSHQVILNGMMTGEEVDAAEAKIDTETESISVRPRPEPEESSACIACGWCLDLCPTSLNPVGLFELANKTDATVLERASPARFTSAKESMSCIGCGLCSYVCPTRLPLMQGILDLRELAMRTAGAAGVPRTVDPEQPESSGDA